MSCSAFADGKRERHLFSANCSFIDDKDAGDAPQITRQSVPSIVPPSYFNESTTSASVSETTQLSQGRKVPGKVDEKVGRDDPPVNTPQTRSFDFAHLFPFQPKAAGSKSVIDIQNG